MSLYRKYRPQTFADVVGQDHVVSTLEQALKQDKLAHAYLFAGSRGTGKTSTARLLAKAIMTKGIEDDVIIKQIEKGVEEGSLVDLLEIDAASNRGIDDVRDLIEKIQFSPVVAAAKVYIIDEVHMLTKEAFNALLKTLEEPPPYAYFILATTELNKIPATIQSRCQCFPFRRINEDDIIRRLQYICDQEKINADREALRGISHHVNGGMRDAISLLDQVATLDSITLEVIEARMGSTGREQMEQVFAALEHGDSDAILQAIKTIEQNGTSLEAFVRQMLGQARENLHAAVAAGEPINQLTHLLDTLLEAAKAIRSAPVPGLVLEAALLSLCDTAEPAKTSGIKKEEKEKEEQKEKEEVSNPTGPPSHHPPSSPKKAPKAAKAEPEPKTTVVAPEASLAGLQDAWPTLVDSISPAAIKMSAKNGRVTDMDDASVTLTFSSGFHRDTVAKADGSMAVEKVLEEHFKKHFKLQCVLEQAEAAEEVAVAKVESEVNLAEAAAEIF